MPQILFGTNLTGQEKILKIKSKTEKLLVVVVGVLLLVLAVSIFTKDPIGSRVVADEASSGSSSEDSGKSEDSGDSEDSENSEGSEDSEDSEESEESESSEFSEESVASQNSGLAGEQSEISEESVESEDSVDELSEESEKSEEFKVVAMEEDRGILKRNEKLFFLFPVEIESEATFNKQGEVIDEKKSFFNWILSVFSF